MIHLQPRHVTLDLTNERNLDAGVEAHPVTGEQCYYLDTETSRVWLTVTQGNDLHKLLSASMGEKEPVHVVHYHEQPNWCDTEWRPIK